MPGMRRTSDIVKRSGTVEQMSQIPGLINIYGLVSYPLIKTKNVYVNKHIHKQLKISPLKMERERIEGLKNNAILSVYGVI